MSLAERTYNLIDEACKFGTRDLSNPQRGGDKLQDARLNLLEEPCALVSARSERSMPLGALRDAREVILRKRNIAIVFLFAAAVVAVLLWPGLERPAGPAGVIGPSAAQISGNRAVEVAGRGTGQAGAAAGPAAPAGSRGPPAVPAPGRSFAVRTEQVRRLTLQDYIELNGDVVMDTSVKVYPYISGRLMSVKTVPGAKVTRGQVLAEVDPSTPGSSFALNPVRAPISGTVLSLPAAPGSAVGVSTVVAEIGVLEGAQVEARVPERHVGALRDDLRASVYLEAYPGVTFSAVVARVSPVVDPVSRTKMIRLAFDRPDARVDPGMFARVRLNTTTYLDRLVVREVALRSDSEGNFVFVVRPDSTAVKRRVRKGAAVDGTAIIESGLAEGETVVVEGAAVLSNGAAVRDMAARESAP